MTSHKVLSEEKRCIFTWGAFSKDDYLLNSFVVCELSKVFSTTQRWLTNQTTHCEVIQYVSSNVKRFTKQRGSDLIKKNL